MKNVLFFCFAALFLVAQQGISQSSFPSCSVKQFNNCAAIYLNNDMLVNDFSPKGRCVVMPDATGILQVYTVNLSLSGSLPFDQVSFKVAISNAESNTLWMYSDETFQTLPIEKVLSKCKMGDKIVLLTVDNQYSLPHHEIFVGDGC